MLEGIGWPAAAASLSLVALSLAATAAIGLGVGRSIVVAAVRAAAQLLAVGSIFATMFASAQAPLWAWLWVAGMVVVACVVVVRRASTGIGVVGPVVVAVVSSTAISLAVVFGFGVIGYEPVAVVVMAGITIGNAVPSTVLGIDKATKLARGRRGELEAALAIGFDRRHTIRFFAPEAARSALIPQIERTKLVGLIALPGAMTGLLLGGVDPIDAVVIQLVVMYLVLGSAAICTITVVVIIIRAATTDDLRTATWTHIES